MKRATPLILLVVVVVTGVVYFLVTARLVGRHLLMDVREPNAFAGPDLVNGYVLLRGMRGPESFIEDSRGNVLIPAPPERVETVGVVRIAVVDAFIFGEIAPVSGSGAGKASFFFIDTAKSEVYGPLSEAAWRAEVQRVTGEPPPELADADSFEPHDADASAR